jgi:hypothetical protein
VNSSISSWGEREILAISWTEIKICVGFICNMWVVMFFSYVVCCAPHNIFLRDIGGNHRCMQLVVHIRY